MQTLINLSAGQVAGWVTGALLILSVFVEITPVKINPLTSLLNWIGKRTNKDLTEKVTKLDDKVVDLESSVGTMQAEIDKRNAITCRVRILRFGDELQHGERHSKENFDQVLSDIDDYESYCAVHPEFKNNRTQLTKAKILETYAACMDQNGFL